ncbi:MAG: HAMP domain-containing protein [bacterium]
MNNQRSDNSKDELQQIAEVTKAMSEGHFDHKLEFEAKGELGELVSSINQTLLNLQQLDLSIKGSSESVPVLAEQLDKISKDTEAVTNKILNKLDSIITVTDQQIKDIEFLHKEREDLFEIVKEIIEKYEGIILSIKNPSPVEKENGYKKAIEFLTSIGEAMKKKIAGNQAAKEKGVELTKTIKQLQADCYEIMNSLQFQDISRQKTDRIILLLKEIEKRLKRLLIIFNIQADGTIEEKQSNRPVVSKHIEEVKLEAGTGKKKG